MYPRRHILFGAAFSLLLFILVPEMEFSSVLLIFLSSFLIDFDHYLVAVFKTGNYGLKKVFHYHKLARIKEKKDFARGIKRKGDFHLFHTIEFHFLIGILGTFFPSFFYVFIGIVFHSLIDLVYLIYEKRFYAREFFFFNWLRKKLF